MVGNLPRTAFKVQPATETVSETAPETGEPGPETLDAGEDQISYGKWTQKEDNSHANDCN